MFEHFGWILLWLFVAYSVVTLVGLVHVIILSRFYGIPGYKEAGVPFMKAPAYVKTKPYQLIYNIILFPFFIWICLQGLGTTETIHTLFIIAIIWTLASIIIDFISWIVIPHPFRFTLKEFYVDYQPWISLIYLSIFVSHYIVLFFV